MSGTGFEFDLFDASQTGIYAAPDEDLGQLAMAARDAGLRTIDTDLSGCRDKATLLLRINTALDAPAGSGRNWDALSDLLRDLEWLGETRGHVLLFAAAEELRTAAPEVFDVFVDVLQDAVDYWAEAGVPFWAFVGLSGNAEDADIDAGS